jgi:uncharacterized protein YqeY
MTITERLAEALKDAMRARDSDRVACIRQVRSKLQEAMNAPDFEGEMSDDDAQKIIASYVKSLQKSIEELRAGGDKAQPLITKYQAEIGYLEGYLPQRLDEDATAALVDSALGELGITDAKQAGRAIGHIMKAHRSEVDAALVRKIVEARLSGNAG